MALIWDEALAKKAEQGLDDGGNQIKTAVARMSADVAGLTGGTYRGAGAQQFQGVNASVDQHTTKIYQDIESLRQIMTNARTQYLASVDQSVHAHQAVARSAPGLPGLN
jgi:uncharacterized protein YukE